MSFRAAANRPWRIDPTLKFLKGLQSWPLFVLVASLFGIDLAIRDPIPLLDELLLGALTYLLGRQKKPEA